MIDKTTRKDKMKSLVLFSQFVTNWPSDQMCHLPSLISSVSVSLALAMREASCMEVLRLQRPMREEMRVREEEREAQVMSRVLHT